MEFQSLFYWNCRLIRGNSVFRGSASPVSILILLELPFDQQELEQRAAEMLSFNPYFIGIAV